jgi:hypothetical protein
MNLVAPAPYQATDDDRIPSAGDMAHDLDRKLTSRSGAKRTNIACMT